MTALAASVLVPVLNEAPYIVACVEAMLEQRLDEDYELLLIDGGSLDGTLELLEVLAGRDDRVRLLDNPGRTVPHALNIGLRAARGAVIVRMDAHTYYPVSYLVDGLERLRRGDVMWVSGPALPHGVDADTRRTALALGTRLGTGGAAFRHAAEEETDAASGFTGLFDREFLERLGGWDEAWPVNQDAELAARLREAGGRIVILPALAARYVPRGSLRALARQYRRYGFYRAKTCALHPGSTELRHAMAPALVLVCGAASLPLGPVRTAGRVAMAGYASTLLVTAVAAARRASARDAAALPLVFSTLHLAWGAGFLVGCARFGVPVRGFSRAARRFVARQAPYRSDR